MTKPNPEEAELLRRIADRTAKVAVIGLGYVGLPLVRAFHRVGFDMLGYDVDKQKIDILRQGGSYIGHLSAAEIAEWRRDDRFVPTSDMQRLRDADAILICVPTPLTAGRDPDLRYVVASTRQIASILRPGQLVVLESTTYPGTTKDVLLPELIRTGLRVGVDFFLAYSPEREDPGNATFSTSNITKVVGGYDVASLRVASALYRTVAPDVIDVSSCEVAEACKILENTYRAVNIALVNEMKLLCDRMGIDVWEVIDAAKTKPFGFQAFYPGPGLGGHCIPIDPFYLSWVARKHGADARFVELAGEVNAAMPHYVVGRLIDALNDRGRAVRGSKIAILGVAYKPDVDDPRESPSFVLMEELLRRGGKVTYHDPHIPRLPKMREHVLPELASCELTAEYLAAQHCVVIATNHSAFDPEFIAAHAPLVIDTRNALKDVKRRDNIVKA
ncbi:MAG: nucleotide sugar dehydrogenase [Planctomycetales bacterium]|nr:nucleotide sugar dehydrogenase [Planctomycetales bacterium]